MGWERLAVLAQYFMRGFIAASLVVGTTVPRRSGVRICSRSVYARRTSRRGMVCVQLSSEHCRTQKGRRRCTYEGTPTAMAKHARIVSPLPYPSALYIAGANSGKPNPASERRKVAAARANQPKASARAYARRLRMGQVTYRKQRAVRMYR